MPLTLRRLFSPFWKFIFPSYGSCFRCHLPWAVVKGHDTYYADGTGCFPLCEMCWGELTPATRLYYYRQMWIDWQKWGEPDKNGVPWLEVWEQIKAAVLDGK